MIQLEPSELAIIKTIVKQYLPGKEICIFGSRTTSTYKPYSDVDLCVMGEEPLTLRQMAELREAFSESRLSMRVDVVDWASTTSEFRSIIQSQAVKI